jgi:hypothetical protein
VGVSDGSGTTFLAAIERSDMYASTVAAQTDGRHWRVLGGFPGDGAQVVTGTGPVASRDRWVLAGFTYDESGCDPDVDGDLCGVMTPAVWTSVDGRDWTTSNLRTSAAVPPTEDDEQPLSVTSVSSVVVSGRGYVAVGADARWWQGARHDTWVSDDGVSWKRLRQPDLPSFDYGPGLLASGYAGVLGFGGNGNEGESSVWELR